MILVLTVEADKKVDTEDGKAFTKFIVRVLKLALHHRGVDLDENNRRQTGQDHSKNFVSSLWPSRKLKGDNDSTHGRRPHQSRIYLVVRTFDTNAQVP